MKRKIKSYEADGIIVEFEPSRCIHAEECIHGLPEVFDPDARPWVDPSRAAAGEIAEVVRHCPTGALHDRRLDGGPAEEPPSENRVRIVAKGPLYASGRLRLHLPSGEVLEETRVALCRCGASENKPFCDNRHREVGFDDRGAAAAHKLGEAESGDGPPEILEIRLAPDGPILLDGRLTVEPAEGEPGSGGKGALCRCGASGSKPYCDGSHGPAGFSGD